MTWIYLALRNLLRNARRSITTIAAVALGYAAVNILAGFTSYMFASIEDAHIYEQSNGHLQIWKKDARDYGGSDPAEYLIEEEDFLRAKNFAASDDRIVFAAGLLEVNGNLDFDGKIGYFFGQGMVPSEKEEINSRSTTLMSPDGQGYEGEAITDETDFAISTATGMADNLGLDVKSDVILTAPTLSGQMNALDAVVYQIVDVASEALDKRYVFMPLSLAQQLYETEGVTCVRLLLENTSDTDAVVAAVKEEFPEDQWEVIAWYDISRLYLRTKNMFDIIFGLVFAIIAVIVTMSVLNTIGMAVVERTREIGTLRALGLKRPGVTLLFGIESGMLGVIGAIIGLLITIAVSLFVAAVEPTWEPPVAAREVVLEIRILPAYLALTFVLLVIFTTLAAIPPARRAAKQSIVDSLGHV